MRKIIFFLGLILVISGCQLNKVQQDNNINNTSGQEVKIENQTVGENVNLLADIFPAIVSELQPWALLWEYDIRNFNQTSFRQVKSEPLQIDWQLQDIVSDSSNPRKPIYQYSPDKKRWLDVYLGRELVMEDGDLKIYNDVDSGVYLYDLENKQGAQIDSCGTSCTFNDALWLDDNHFIVVGLENHQDANNRLYESGQINTTGYTPIISYYDLSMKTKTDYQSIYYIADPLFKSPDYLKAKYFNKFEEIYRLAQNQAKIIPVGYFKDKQTQKEGIAYLKKEYYQYNLYKVIAGQVIKTEASLIDTCRFDANYSCFNATISPDGEYLAYSAEYTENSEFGGYWGGIVLALIDLARPKEIIEIEGGPGGHYEVEDNLFFNPESTKLLYSSQGGDENGGGGSISEYDIKMRNSNVLFGYSNSCDLEANTCSGDFYDRIIPLGYASFNNQISPFYIVSGDNKNIVYKDKKPFVRYNISVELGEIGGGAQITNDSKYYYYLSDNTLNSATLGAILEGENLSGTHNWEDVIMKSKFGGPHGAITDFKLSQDKILFIDSTGDERCQEEELFSLEGDDKKLIDSQNYCNE